jgi:proline racemase
LDVLDTHTEGEPTRVVLAGWPAPPGRTLAEQRAALAATQDALRRAVVCEPRGHDAVVGALLTAPVSADTAAGVIFFNNVGTLGMCGHGLIGVVRALQFMGRLAPGRVQLDTPVGPVAAQLETDGAVTIENVPAYCHARDVRLDVPGVGSVQGDVAWGGNWFFLASLPAGPALDLAHVDELTRSAVAIRRALAQAGVTGAAGAEIDHVELLAPAPHAHADARVFVLCPGLAYDRSPCGTGTSAKMAVLHARGQLAVRQVWRQESITGGLFSGWLEQRGEALVPFVRGRAFVTARATLHFDPADPLRGGFDTAG